MNFVGHPNYFYIFGGPKLLKDAPYHIRNNRYIIMKAVRQNGDSLAFATPDLQSDREVVLAAVQENGRAIEYASPQFQSDKEIVIAVIKNDKYAHAINFVPPELRNKDGQVFMAIVEKSEGIGFYIESISSSELWKDKDLVLAIVKKYPDTIKYAHEDLKRDRHILSAAGMFDEDHRDAVVRKERNKDATSRKIVLSARFSLNQGTHSEATIFTAKFKNSEYIKNSFTVYAPNAFDKKTCDPEWTDFDWPCRGTNDTCRFDNALNKGRPTDNCCWRYSFRSQLQEAKDTGGFMLVESDPSKTNRPFKKYPYVGPPPQPQLGNGQRIESDMANAMGIKVFQVYHPVNFDGIEITFHDSDINVVTKEISQWYNENNRCQDDMSVTIIRPMFPLRPEPRVDYDTFTTLLPPLHYKC